MNERIRTVLIRLAKSLNVQIASNLQGLVKISMKECLVETRVQTKEEAKSS